MLQRMKNLKCIVFTATVGQRTGIFIGWASPETIRWHLAADQPWLESAFAAAYSMIASGAAQSRGSLASTRSDKFTSVDGSLSPPDAQLVVGSFVQSLKQAPPHVLPTEFVSIASGDERATWVTTPELNRIGGSALWTESVPYSTSEEQENRKAYIRRILRKRGSYVAVTVDGAFKSLVNRMALLDEVAMNLL